MLFRLNISRAVVWDIPMRALYGNEQFSLFNPCFIEREPYPLQLFVLYPGFIPTYTLQLQYLAVFTPGANRIIFLAIFICDRAFQFPVFISGFRCS